MDISIEQIRQFRLHAHHLDTFYKKEDAGDIASACGLQNSPPGAWENAFYARIPDLKRDDMRRMLEVEKTLLQAWSFRGAPVVFPASESDAFLSALVSNRDEPWIYTKGIQLALDFLQMPFEELLALLLQVMPKLDGEVIKSKAALDQTLAEWMLPLLPKDKRELWVKPSLYGNPTVQSVGGAVVSFLLRPCAFMGLVVFAKKEGISPTFTSYKHWIGHPLETNGIAGQKLLRKFLHCYGPATVGGFADWLGCSFAQAERLWQSAKDEMEPVNLLKKVRYVLSEDKKLLLSPPQSQRKVHLLAGHDPYLGLQDREIILNDKARQKQIWQNVSNPGAVLWQGEIVGMWKAIKKGKGLDMEIELWGDADRLKGEIQDLAEGYALFEQRRINKFIFG